GRAELRFAPGGKPLLFAATDPVIGRELWSTDGTTDGTRLVRNIAADDVQTEAAGVDGLVRMGESVFFLAGPYGSAEIWRTDGTESGTTKITHLNERASDSFFSDLIVSGDRLFFAFGSVLWVSDGTESGTIALTDPPMLGRYLYLTNLTR